MNKYLITGALLLSLMLPLAAFAQTQGDIDPNASQGQCVTINNNLRFGARDSSTGGDVSALQDYLNAQGYLSSQPTGYFGSQTLAAVTKFQVAGNLTASGYVGPLTRALIHSKTCTGIINNPPVLNPGCSPGFLYSSTTGKSCSNPPQTITVVSPNGGEKWIAQSVQPIIWNYPNVTSDSKVDLYLIDAVCWNMPHCTLAEHIPFILDKNIPANATYNWIVGTDINNNSILPNTSATYRLVVCTAGTDLNNPNRSIVANNCGESDKPFSIVNPISVTSPTITNISPASASVGSTITITGTGFTIGQNLVALSIPYNTSPQGFNYYGYYYVNSTDGTTLSFKLTQTLSGCGRYPLTPPFYATTCPGFPATPGSYPIYVTSLNGKSNTVPFTITKSTPTITITSPQANYGLTRGTYSPVTWTTTGMDTSYLMDIFLVGPNGATYTMAHSIFNTGSYNLFINTDLSNNILPDGTYSIKVCDELTDGGSATCDVQGPIYISPKG